MSKTKTKFPGLTTGRVPERIAQYFADNPDEELTMEDARLIFDLKKVSLHETLCRLRALGIVETVHLVRAKRGVAGRRPAPATVKQSLSVE